MTTLCERCGGTGRQPAGCWNGTACAAPAGRCDDCHGTGLLGMRQVPKAVFFAAIGPRDAVPYVFGVPPYVSRFIEQRSRRVVGAVVNAGEESTFWLPEASE